MNYTAASAAAPDDNVFYDSGSKGWGGDCTLQHISDVRNFICNISKTDAEVE